MATLTAAYATEKDPWKLAGIVASTALVLWIAHVYSDAISHSITHTRPTLRGLGAIAREEVGIVLAAVPPLLALVLGAFGAIRESRAAWLALATGLFVLAAQGVRYARLEGFSRAATVVATAINLGLGLLVVALKVVIAH